MIEQYIAGRDLHRPRTVEGLRAAIRELERQGLRVRDIAQALRIPITEVLAIMRAVNAERPQQRCMP